MISTVRICLYIVIWLLSTDIRDSNMNPRSLRKYDLIHAQPKTKMNNPCGLEPSIGDSNR